MRTTRLLLVATTLVACGSGEPAPDAGRDASGPVDAGGDAPVQVRDAAAESGVDAGSDAADAAANDSGDDAGAVDAATEGGAADAAACPRTLLVGGSNLTVQGWSVIQQAPATLTYGADFVKIQTTTSAGAATGGQLLLHYPGAFVPGQPFKIQVEMLVAMVAPHNASDSAAAIMGSITGSFGSPTERSEMVYVDPSAVGWADNTGSFATTVVDGAYHTYVLSVDASGNAVFTVDGTTALTRAHFTTNGDLAIGDQTNEPNLDATIQVRSVTQLCP